VIFLTNLKERVGVFMAHHGLKGRGLPAERGMALEAARGRVLEIGSGTGLNRPHYPLTVKGVVGLDPSLLALTQASRRSALGSDQDVVAVGERLPFGTAVFDTVVTTYVMCLVLDPALVATEIRRVLTANGIWLFLEHGQSPEGRIFKWQQRWAKATRLCCGGCEPDRAILSIIAAGGFTVSEVATYYRAGPKPLSYTYRGVASPA